jgi:hypothetical protein
MRPIARRLRRLEARFTPPADPEAERVVAPLCERMRRHGMECDDAGNEPPQNHQHQTLREVLRARFTESP